jgi:hypothetical protein
MQITIQPIAPLGGGHLLTRQVEGFVRELLAAEGDRLAEVVLRHGLGSDAETVDDDLHCDLRARLVGGERVVVSHAAPTLVQALHGAVAKLRLSLEASAEPALAD